MVLIFISGVAVGGVAGSMIMRERMLNIFRHPEQAADRFLPQLRAELNLSDEQMTMVTGIVRNRYARMEAIRAEAWPKQMDEFETMQQEIREVLDQRQLEAWRALSTKVERQYFPARPTGPPPADFLFRQFDANSDGAIVPDEVPPPMWIRLQGADANGDGRVSPEEYESALPPRNAGS